MWKYVLPDDQFDMRVNGWVTNMSWKENNTNIIIGKKSMVFVIRVIRMTQN
jgi:hypothetical protein